MTYGATVLLSDFGGFFYFKFFPFVEERIAIDVGDQGKRSKPRVVRADWVVVVVVFCEGVFVCDFQAVQSAANLLRRLLGVSVALAARHLVRREAEMMTVESGSKAKSGLELSRKKLWCGRVQEAGWEMVDG